MRVAIAVHPTESRALTIMTRNARTGADGQSITLLPGQHGELDVTDEDHLVGIPGAAAEPAQGAATALPGAEKTATVAETVPAGYPPEQDPQSGTPEAIAARTDVNGHPAPNAPYLAGNAPFEDEALKSQGVDPAEDPTYATGAGQLGGIATSTPAPEPVQEGQDQPDVILTTEQGSGVVEPGAEGPAAEGAQTEQGGGENTLTGGQGNDLLGGQSSDAIQPPAEPAPTPSASDPAVTTDTSTSGGQGEGDTSSSSSSSESPSTNPEYEVAGATVINGEPIPPVEEVDATDTPDPTEPTDAQVAAIMVALETEPSVEKTKDGLIQVDTINQALERKGFKRIDAARRTAVQKAATKA